MSQSLQRELALTVENVGGIDRTSVSIGPGVTVLAGRNATNRTSLLRALMAAFGSEHVSLKADADAGSVRLELGEETYDRTLERRNGTVVTGGDPYLEDPTLADLFAFCLESNEARRAVETGGDLREIMMRPVDTEAIQSEIDALQAEKRELAADVEALGDLEDRRRSLEADRESVETDIESTRSELEAIEADLAELDADVSEAKAEDDAVEEALEDLEAAREQRQQLRYDIDTQEESLEELRAERDELGRELESLQTADEGRLATVEERIEAQRTRKRELESALNELQSLVQFNEEMLAGSAGPAALAGETEDAAAVTDRLVDTDTRTCWTCGSEVERDQIEATVGRLRELRQEKLSAVEDVKSELSELKAERDELEGRRDRRKRLEEKLERTATEIDERTETLEAKRDQRETIEEAIEELEAAVDEAESDAASEVLEKHRAANDLEFELGRLERKRESIEEELSEIESRLADREAKEARLETVTADLEELRTRVDGIEREAIEAFNEHMDTVLAQLEYENLDRVWLERREREVRDGRGTSRERVFDLHIVRSTADGATFEDTIDHLSESEREVVGLVFALAGYLVHDVHEELPVMVLDSLEAIDPERIANLVEYVADYADFLVVALLPEDAAALPDSTHRLTEI